VPFSGVTAYDVAEWYDLPAGLVFVAVSMVGTFGSSGVSRMHPARSPDAQTATAGTTGSWIAARGR
jgi:hypothetical protein